MKKYFLYKLLIAIKQAMFPEKGQDIVLDFSEEIAKMNEKKKPVFSPDIIITNHAYERAKERLSLNRSAFTSLAEKAYELGACHSDSVGNLKKYIDGIYFQYKTANHIRIYGCNVYLFNNNTLITVYAVPNNLKKAALKIQKT